MNLLIDLAYVWVDPRIRFGDMSVDRSPHKASGSLPRSPEPARRCAAVQAVLGAALPQQGRAAERRRVPARRSSPRSPRRCSRRTIRSRIRLIQRLKPPGYVNGAGITFWLGTDMLGRDVLSRIIYGARVSLIVGLSAVAISGTIGLLLGLVSGYFGGIVDDVFMRVADIQLSFPTILLALAIMAVLGSGLDKLILVLGLTGWVQYGRIVRGQVLSIKEEEFVLAARATGETAMAHPVPAHPAEHLEPDHRHRELHGRQQHRRGSLAQLPRRRRAAGIPSWGTMLADGRQYIGVADWLTIPAGLAISLTVLSINILGDWLRDYPRPAPEEHRLTVVRRRQHRSTSLQHPEGTRHETKHMHPLLRPRSRPCRGAPSLAPALAADKPVVVLHERRAGQPGPDVHAVRRERDPVDPRNACSGWTMPARWCRRSRSRSRCSIR